MTITGNDKLTALKHLANGRDPAFAAATIGAAQDAVTALGEEYGWPDVERLRWSVDELQRQERVAERAALPKATTTSAAQAVSVARPAPRPAPVTPPSVTSTVGQTSVDHLTGLLNRAEKLTGPGAAKVQRAASKARQAVDDLEQALTELEEKKRAAARENAAKAKARSDVARLERELAAAKALLRGKPASKASSMKATSSGDGPTAKAIRTWAAEHDVVCPSVGRIPAHVREQYDQAHATAAA